ncbi:cardiolipin synthase [Paenibacillus antibioticophila]|uniref:Cardiolipin synthase n=1 Tax=Paenibacillus antibioticophila TaxID=1274374 RepID=A0A919XXX3_9BACL|nr:cardiolipin synthase [Paenibacillus antibioticophila]GIO40079.1 cardiolipin synthase [Paenibacillus antibioticophila]
MIWLSLLLLAFIFQIATILVLEFRNPGRAVAWMLILFAVPLIGFVLYYFVAQDYKKRRKLRRRGSPLFQEIKARLWQQTEIIDSIEQMKNKDFQGQERLFGLLTRLSESPITGCNETEIYSSGEPAFHAMLEAMYRARHHIHIEFYIFRDDGIGRQFKQAMIEKARQGVKVRLVCDGLGSYQLPQAFVKELEQAGAEVYFFLPPLIAMLDRRVNYRNHRKILVVDGQVGFVGGLNIGDDYLGLYENMGYWRDTHLRISGDAVYDLQRTFLGDWQLASGSLVSESGLFPEHCCKGEEHVQILTSGPDQHWDAIQEMWFGAIAVAKKRIWITSPYFIPDPSIYAALKTAAVAGVEVIVLLPYHSDSRLVKLASLSYVEELMQAGVRFYEYTKGFVHAKVLIVDDLVGTVGTANMDMRSFFFNFEMLALLFDREPIKRLERDFLQDLSDSREIRQEEFMTRPRRQKGAELVARLLSPLL